MIRQNLRRIGRTRDPRRSRVESSNSKGASDDAPVPPSTAEELWRTAVAFRRIVGGMHKHFHTPAHYEGQNKPKQLELTQRTELTQVFAPSKSRALCPALLGGSKCLRACVLREGSGVGTQGD